MMEEENTTTSRAAAATIYESVYCGNLEGKLEVTDEGIYFRSYVPSSTSATTPHDILWRDTTYRDFSEQQVPVSVSGYVTQVALFNLKLGILPSREVTFSMRHQDEWDRLQCDLDSRGYGAPPPPQPQSQGLDDDPQDYDDPTEAVDNDIKEQEHSEWSVSDDDENQGDNPDDESADDEGADDDLHDNSNRNMSHHESEADEVDWEEVDDSEEDEMSNQGHEYTAAPNSSYYPVYHKEEVGNLRLSGSHLEFIPDRHSADVKSLPWASLAGKPAYSPYNYPQALMRVQYHRTSGPNKKAAFELANQEEIARLEQDMRERMKPWRNAPRQRVHVPPRMPKQDPNKPTKVNNLKGGSTKSKKPGIFNGKKRVAPLYDESITGGTDRSTSHGDESMMAVPLVARKVPYHQEENKRRMLMLFCAYCCIVTFTILSAMVVLGYFFGPRKPRGYIRTKPPGTIDVDYLGTNPPTSSPTAVTRESWNSEIATLKRDSSLTEVPQTENPVMDGMERPDRGADDLNVTQAPTTQQTRSDRTILDVLLALSPDGGEALRTSGTPQQAAYLLVKVSGALDEANSDAVIEQKYALSTIYYAAGGDEWNDGSEGWKDLANSDCTKPHVECNGSPDIITGIDMPSNNMRGFIPPEIVFLSNLQHLNLRGNDIEFIPTELGRLVNLKTIDVSGNPKLTTIPEEIRSLPGIVVKADIP
jgi:Leucine Rich repeats (2 copies)